MNSGEFFLQYFPAITLIVVLFLAVFVMASLFKLNFAQKKNQEVTKSVTFESGV